MKNTFWVSGWMFDSNQFAHVFNANLYAVVTLYSWTSSGDPYLEQNMF